MLRLITMFFNFFGDPEWHEHCGWMRRRVKGRWEYREMTRGEKEEAFEDWGNSQW